MPLAWLSLLALGLGVITGFGAVVFRALIGLIHNVLFAGHAVVHYDANVFTPPAPWGAWIILIPVLGAIGVTFLVNKFAPEAKGHGVPEVMDAIYYKGGAIRPIVALVKSVASAIAIGSGASVGREGPIIQIGSAIGSTFGQIIRMPAGQRIALVAAGAGAGIAATFNTPIGGVHVRHRADDARGERGDIPSGRHRDRDGDVRGTLVLRRCAGLQRAAASSHGGRFERAARARPVCRAGCRDRRRRRGIHSRTASGRGSLRSDRVPLSAAHVRHADARRAHVLPLPHPGSVLRRRCRLRDCSGGADGADLDVLAAWGCSPCASCWRPRSVWDPAHPAASFRPRCSWVRPSAAASRHC